MYDIFLGTSRALGQRMHYCDKAHLRPWRVIVNHFPLNNALATADVTNLGRTIFRFEDCDCDPKISYFAMLL